ncbi:MAG: hypothetical protein U0234_10360 [Sandaracinus sp.]
MEIALGTIVDGSVGTLSDSLSSVPAGPLHLQARLDSTEDELPPQIAENAQLWESLESLVLRFDRSGDSASTPDLRRFERLRDVSVIGIRGAMRLGLLPSQLRRLSFHSWAREIPEIPVVGPLMLPRLETLHLSGACLNDSQTVAAVANLPRLEELHLVRSSALPGTVEEVLRSTSLKYLRLTGPVQEQLETLPALRALVELSMDEDGWRRFGSLPRLAHVARHTVHTMPRKG